MTQTIGQYEIRDLLGEGGLGQVHAAYDTVLQREVAIKSLRPELLSDTNFVERFRAEATSLARLNHPNITTIYSLVPEGKNLYMVMELVRGHTLDDILKERKGPIGVQESLAIIAQAADGLGYAHSMGVIHRDIKPSNLMIAENGVLKIMDFGIARVRGSQRLTRSGSIVGTLAYMAPEQLRGEEGDETCDLYSLAIVLYEMLSGSPPFSATSEYELMQAQINKRPDRLLSRVPGLDKKVEGALLKALSKKPAQRFASTRAFSDALGASSLRMDAPKILHNDTRLLETPAFPITVAPLRQSLWDQIIAAPAAVLPFWDGLSADLRAAALGGSAALVVGILVFGFMFFPESESKAPAVTTAKPAVTATVTPTTVNTPATRPPSATPGSRSPGATPPGNNTLATPGRPMSLNDIIAAANAGDPGAQNILGVKYATGEDGLPRDDAKAVAWYTKAAQQGFAKAETNLGDMYLNGRGGLDKDPVQALTWYLKAADQNFAEAQYRLGYMFETGSGVARDLPRAVTLFRAAADENYPPAQYKLGTMYESANGVSKDGARAVTLFRAAADAGYPDAENVLGILYATGGDGLSQDEVQAVLWYRKAADQGFAKAEKNLGDMYFFGRGVEKDYQQAITWYTKASDQGFADATYLLGVMNEKGLGVPQSDQNALALYQQAAKKGSVDGKKAADRLGPKVSAATSSNNDSKGGGNSNADGKGAASGADNKGAASSADSKGTPSSADSKGANGGNANSGEGGSSANTSSDASSGGSK